MRRPLRHPRELTRGHFQRGTGAAGGRADFAYATFVNSNAADAFSAELSEWLVRNYHPSPPAEAPGLTDPGPVDRAPFAGVFRRMTSKITIKQEGENLGVDSE